MIVCINLFFIALIAVNACMQEPHKEVEIVWNDDKAKAIRIAIPSIPGFTKETGKLIRVQQANDTVAILGAVTEETDAVYFTPPIPFSRGNNYEVFFGDKKIAGFEVPAGDANDAPELITSYPTADTVPENLLKIYLQFSHPMREGQSAKYIYLIKNSTDTLHDVFLDLQPELWNEDRTVLSMWLDPGRIKRELQPNQRLGNPLHKGTHYRLFVADRWQDTQGRNLKKHYTRSFIVGERDDLSPDLMQWQLQLPAANTQQPLKIAFKEPLDHFLLQECLHISNPDGKEFTGTFHINTADHTASFIPAHKWIAGKYSLLADAKLEDLAGNNFNRPFDRDMTTTKEKEAKGTYTRDFEVRAVH